jgi:hypothetical protein
MALAEKVEALVARVGYRPLHGMVLVSGVDGAAAATQQQQQQQQQQEGNQSSGGPAVGGAFSNPLGDDASSDDDEGASSAVTAPSGAGQQQPGSNAELSLPLQAQSDGIEMADMEADRNADAEASPLVGQGSGVGGAASVSSSDGAPPPAANQAGGGGAAKPVALLPPINIATMKFEKGKHSVYVFMPFPPAQPSAISD